MPTEIIINYLESKNIPSNINKLAFDKAYNFSSKIFKHV